MTTLPSPAPPSRRLDTGSDKSAVARAAVDRRGRDLARLIHQCDAIEAAGEAVNGTWLAARLRELVR